MVLENTKPYIVALTGGIASGKTAVSNLLASFGVAIIDTDVIAHELTQKNGLALPEIARVFGVDFLNESTGLDRTKMRNLVFNNPIAKQQLEAILHPMIHRVLLEQTNLASNLYAPYLVWVIPLLIKPTGEVSAYREKVNEILVVDCPESTQLERLMKRSKLDLTQAQAILNAQATRLQRHQYANRIITNDGDIDSLTQQTQQSHLYYLNQAKKVSQPN